MNKQESKPTLSAYESILLICSGLVKKGKVVVHQDDFIKKLFALKDDASSACLFEDIVFKNNIDSIFSEDIDDSLIKLQTYGAIGKLNPAYEKIVIYISLEEADKFLRSYNQFSSNIDYVCSKL